MKVSVTINGLIHLAHKFDSVGDVSIYNLLKETGYFENHDKIFIKNIRAALKNHPECVDDWMLYSDNKRSRSGWYFKQKGTKGYIVGYLSENKGGNACKEFSNRVDACALFIKHEVDDIKEC